MMTELYGKYELKLPTSSVLITLLNPGVINHRCVNSLLRSWFCLESLCGTQ
jgi:hypothetical protein